MQYNVYNVVLSVQHVGEQYTYSAVLYCDVQRAVIYCYEMIDIHVYNHSIAYCVVRGVVSCTKCFGGVACFLCVACAGAGIFCKLMFVAWSGAFAIGLDDLQLVRSHCYGLALPGVWELPWILFSCPRSCRLLCACLIQGKKSWLCCGLSSCYGFGYAAMCVALTYEGVILSRMRIVFVIYSSDPWNVGSSRRKRLQAVT